MEGGLKGGKTQTGLPSNMRVSLGRSVSLTACTTEEVWVSPPCARPQASP